MEEAYNSSFTGPEIDEAVAAVRQKENAWDGKLDAAAAITMEQVNAAIQNQISEAVTGAMEESY